MAGALECTLLPPTLTVKGTCIVAFTGADMEPTINSVRVPRYIPFVCHDGDVISGGFSQCGVRMYISFSGGIDVPSINGSVSTHTKAKIGGLEGRPLQTVSYTHLDVYKRQSKTLSKKLRLLVTLSCSSMKSTKPWALVPQAMVKALKA